MSIAQRIEDKLRAALAPVSLAVENESHMHSVPKGSETHFKVVVVSAAFEGLGRVDRHRRVNDALATEFKLGLHALTLRALTEGEAAAGGLDGFVSPACLGGSKADGPKHA
jgi:BolA protein